jgi:hypothetical protein
MKGDVIYYSAVGDIVKMTDAMIVDEFVLLYVGTSKGLDLHTFQTCFKDVLMSFSDVQDEIIVFNS